MLLFYAADLFCSDDGTSEDGSRAENIEDEILLSNDFVTYPKRKTASVTLSNKQIHIVDPYKSQSETIKMDDVVGMLLII